MRQILKLLPFAPLLCSCSQPFAVRFPDCAFATQPGQRVLLVTSRGRTSIQGVIASRDIVVRGTVQVLASSPDGAAICAQAVKVIETSTPNSSDPLLRLEVIGIPSSGGTQLDAEFLVPKDIRLEIQDGPEDLTVRELDAGITIRDTTGKIDLADIKGPVEIDDQDGDIQSIRGEGPMKIVDRRGDIRLEEITGNIDIRDREGDVHIQSVTGNVVMSKQGRGFVRINNLDGTWEAREWADNPLQPVINTIWPRGGDPKSPPAPPKDGKAPAERMPAPAKKDGP